MERDKFIEKITQSKRFLIDYANLSENLFLYQKSFFQNKKSLERYLRKPYKGLPIIFPTRLSYFKYQTTYKYNISKDFLKNKLFRLKHLKKKYKPCDFLSSFGSAYSNKVVGILGKKNQYIFNRIIKFNKKSKLKIDKILKKYKKVCSFQTRNIPHAGHELIIKRLLMKFDHVIINPVIGPKKKGDVNYQIIRKAFNFLIERKYTNKKLSYIPILANMFYAGPYEALHHANIRAALGFKFFLVGRDHAGAQDAYRPNSSFNLINKYKNRIKINIVPSKGSYYCAKCKKIIIKGDCNHQKLQNISGTNFRNNLKKNLFFEHADYAMQVYLKKYKNLFIK